MNSNTRYKSLSLHEVSAKYVPLLEALRLQGADVGIIQGPDDKVAMSFLLPHENFRGIKDDAMTLHHAGTWKAETVFKSILDLDHHSSGNDNKHLYSMIFPCVAAKLDESYGSLKQRVTDHGDAHPHDEFIATYEAWFGVDVPVELKPKVFITNITTDALLAAHSAVGEMA